MPTYDYVCEACGHEFEHFQSMSDKRLGKCPACKKPRLVRKVGAGAGVIFKGTGFYQTDYKAKKPSESPSKEGSSPEAPKDSGSKEPSSKDASSSSAASDGKGGGSAKDAAGAASPAPKGGDGGARKSADDSSASRASRDRRGKA